ncbi:amidase [Mycena sp. CBHHK59/15]|nr:amidase [Mycena sp. CBHHK59/15]
MWPFSSGYQAISDAKRGQRDAAIAAAPEYSASKHGVYLKATASEIVAHIERSEWTAAQVVEAYIARAAVAHRTTNCLTEVLFAQALEKAAELDAEFVATKTLRGLLHGVPISIKDQYDIAGVDATMGFSALANKPAATNADVVALLTAAGAIPIAKTNVPQTMFSFECCNPLFGRTTHPRNAAYTCGGSSGGEAALLAMDGSALGVGSDIGGSLRIPAAYCGIYSLKPSPNRVSYFGAGETVPGFEGITSVSGPMGRSIDDLEIFCRIALGIPGRSQTVAPVLYRQPKLAEKLRFGYYTGKHLLIHKVGLTVTCWPVDYYFKASPANKRAVLETVAALQKEGHECIEVQVPDPQEPFNIVSALVSSDGFKTLLSGIGSDPLDSSLLVIANAPKLPRFISLFFAWVVETFLKDPKFANAVRATGVKPFGEYLKWTKRRNNYIAKFYEEVWDKHELDGIIAPTQAIPQVPTGQFTTLFSLASATTLYNLVNSSVGCMPVTTVDPARDQLTEEWTKVPSPSLVESALYQAKKPVYDPVATKGMPVAVQIVGKKWDDEKVLDMMRVVDAALGRDRGFGPGNWDTRRD